MIAIAWMMGVEGRKPVVVAARRVLVVMMGERVVETCALAVGLGVSQARSVGQVRTSLEESSVAEAAGLVAMMAVPEGTLAAGVTRVAWG